jgi:hypothetical protein
MADRPTKLIVLAVLVLGGVTVFLFVLMNRFTYGKVGDVPIRTNRLTGGVERLYQGQWMTTGSAESYSSLLEQVQSGQEEMQALRKAQREAQLAQQKLNEDLVHTVNFAAAELVEWEVAETMGGPISADDLKKLTTKVVADGPNQTYAVTIHNHSDCFVTQLEVKFIPRRYAVEDEAYLPRATEEGKYLTTQTTAYHAGLFLGPDDSRCLKVESKPIALELCRLLHANLPSADWQEDVVCKVVAGRGMSASAPQMKNAAQRGAQECIVAVPQSERR